MTAPADVAGGLSLAEVPGLLEAAAERVLEVAGAATPGPWSLETSRGDCADDGRQRTWGQIPDVLNERYGMNSIDVGTDLGTGRWIALASPAIAPHLAAVLREHARVARWVARLDSGDPMRARIAEDALANPGVRGAVELARLILPGWTAGETSGLPAVGAAGLEPGPDDDPGTSPQEARQTASGGSGASCGPQGGSGDSGASNRDTRASTPPATAPETPATPPPGDPDGLGVPTAGSGAAEGPDGPSGACGVERDSGGDPR